MDFIVVRNDIRDPLATMKDLFVSFRFIEPSSDNLRLIIKFENTIFIHKLDVFSNFNTSHSQYITATL